MHAHIYTRAPRGNEYRVYGVFAVSMCAYSSVRCIFENVRDFVSIIRLWSSPRPLSLSVPSLPRESTVREEKVGKERKEGGEESVARHHPSSPLSLAPPFSSFSLYASRCPRTDRVASLALIPRNYFPLSGY